MLSVESILNIIFYWKGFWQQKCCKPQRRMVSSHNNNTVINWGVLWAYFSYWLVLNTTLNSINSRKTKLKATICRQEISDFGTHNWENQKRHCGRLQRNICTPVHWRDIDVNGLNARHWPPSFFTVTVLHWLQKSKCEIILLWYYNRIKSQHRVALNWKTGLQSSHARKHWSICALSLTSDLWPLGESKKTDDSSKKKKKNWGASSQNNKTVSKKNKSNSTQSTLLLGEVRHKGVEFVVKMWQYLGCVRDVRHQK